MRGPIVSSFKNGVFEGKIEYRHKSSHEHSTAYNLGESCELFLYFPRSLGVKSAYVRLKTDESFVCSYKAEFYSLDDGYDIFKCVINTAKIGVGLYFFDIACDSFFGIYFGKKDGLGVKLSPKDDGVFFQLTVSSFKYSQCEEAKGGIIYHVFVDRFNKGGRSQTHSDEVFDSFDKGIPEFPEYPGAPLKNNVFYGGTLDGIAHKLDYIKSLGVNIIYLSPIFEAKSNHKYDTADYSKVDSIFGGDEAFKSLIKKAKSKGIGIILDGVFNHTGSDSIYFNKLNTYESLGAYQSCESPYFSWYDFKKHPDDYVCWWGIEILPRIHPDRKECRDYFVSEGGIIDKYAKMGILGFRLDVADELSDEFISLIKERLNSNNSQSILLGEVWEDASNKIAYDTRKKYYLGNELDGVMNYPLRTGIIDYITRKDTRMLYYALTEVTNNAPKRIRDTQMNLLGTHDTERILTVLAGESSAGKTNAYLWSKRMSPQQREKGIGLLCSAYTVLATLPGVPSIFYADEAGLEGYGDPFNRMPYPWGKEDKRLLSHYQRIGKIRRGNSVYKEGSFSLIYLDENLLIFKRVLKSYSYITILNNSENDISLTFDGRFEALITSGSYPHGFEFSLKKHSEEIFKIKNTSNIIIK